MPPTEADIAEREARAEACKNEGNDLFRQGKYQEAADMYNEAVNIYGTQPTYMNNLAATYLKLEKYELAEGAASMALLHDPRLLKARYRRGLARKALNKFSAAGIDFATILKDLDPNCAEAKVELAEVREMFRTRTGEDETEIWTDHEYPAPDEPPKPIVPIWLAVEEDDSVSDPGSEVNLHVGNGVPCKHHNLKVNGCAKGEACAYSHAPDARSVPDSEGRNVCLYFLLGSCKYERRCFYLHSKKNLATDVFPSDLHPRDVQDIIRANEDEIELRRLSEKYMGKGPYLPINKELDQHARKRRKARKLVDRIHDAPVAGPSTAPEPFILHLTLNKFSILPQITLSGLGATISRASTKKKASELLSSPALIGVYITDAGIMEDRNAPLQIQLARYVRGGGTVVLGGSFQAVLKGRGGMEQTDATAAQLDEYLSLGWGVSWKLGMQGWTSQAVLALNSNSDALKKKKGLPATYRMQGLHLKDVPVHEAVYLPAGQSLAGNSVETPVAFAQLGKGRLGFAVDAHQENGTTAVVRAMFGLN
ncbi:hypothetical protein FB45DRAFT_803766 [Roridomyces roridus]|uniref:C3H1-type domain-containing protein n=1 Tax=Roridomyces roridus TaxID=1738132 RepID=A0AAD7B5Z3_9AGAR|nr:hypothetical protein FB45DRAFT_803766 [Roridomyces roridus]